MVQVRALLQPPSPPDYPGGWDTQRDAFFAGLAGYGFAIGPADACAQAGRHPMGGAARTHRRPGQGGLPGPPAPSRPPC